ncbi:hypothetical protein [Paenibacillus jiagnxiensis]|uniref:hypothetical protein n=1 Tax=Paenibacillus jiagnxiensis TaxID=3228926 RepID=UPI0033A33185
MPNARLFNNEGPEDSENSLKKITTYLPREDLRTIREFTSDGSKQAEHFRIAIREYCRREKMKRKKF